MLNKVGGRKMAVGFLTLGIGVAFAAIKGDVNPGLLQLLSVVFGAFVVGNGFEHIANARKPAKAAEAQQSESIVGPAFATLQAQIDDISSQVKALQTTMDTASQASGVAVAEIRALVEQAATSSATAAEALAMIINARQGRQPARQPQE